MESQGIERKGPNPWTIKPENLETKCSKRQNTRSQSRKKTVRFSRRGAAAALRHEGYSRVKWSKGKEEALTGTGSVEGQHRRGWRYSPLAGHLAGSQTDNSAALFVHEAQPSAVPVRLGPVVLVGPGCPRRQLGSDHELSAFRVEPPTVAGVSCERESQAAPYSNGTNSTDNGEEVNLESESLPLECHYPLNKL